VYLNVLLEPCQKRKLFVAEDFPICLNLEYGTLLRKDFSKFRSLMTSEFALISAELFDNSPPISKTNRIILK